MEKNTKIILIVVTVLVVLCIIGVVLAVVYGTKTTTTPVVVPPSQPSVPSGNNNTPPTPPAPTKGLIVENTDIGGYDMDNMPTRNVASLDECFKLCDVNPDCQWVNYVKKTQDCYLKHGVKATGVTTQTANFFADGYDIPSGNLPNTPLKGIQTSDECYSKCASQTNPACHWSNYVTSTQDCWLRSATPNSAVDTQFKKNK
jgi:hypothetical protein